jgi:CRISPR/Cas system-associated protein Cas10 (large subunit of type III CRISPR-Cas system)
MDYGSIIGIAGIVITTVVAVYAIRDVRKQVRYLISVERQRLFARVRNDMVWLFVDPTELAHSVDIAKGLEEFNLITVAIDPKQTADITNNVVNNEALVYAEKLVKGGYATWKPGWNMEKVKQTVDEWKQPPN